MDCKYILFLLLSFAFRYPANTQASRPVLLPGSDSALTCASHRYEAHSFLRTIFMGKNYRKQWQQPVTLPVFRLSETGFSIAELGGGQQTKSLKLTDRAGKTWALRTIDKDVSGAIPGWLQNSFAHQLKQDQISASMPYSSLLIGELAEALGINAARPTIYLVADDPALGAYRQIFANSVCMLEERDPHFATTGITVDVLRQVQKDNRFLIDQKVWLRARLFDMLINDWDRHYDNWRWGLVDSAGLHFYKAIPRDRDWAFYCSDGLLLKLLRLTTDRFLINFSPEVKYVKSLNAKAYYMDAAFLNGLDAGEWEKSVGELQSALTDEAIEKAVKKLPPPIFSSLGQSFIRKLKSRRDGLLQPVMKYYRLLAKDVQIDGSNEAETFSVLPAGDGFLLQIFNHEKTADGSPKKIYERRFVRSETHRVTINGLAGDDVFIASKQVPSKIKLKINGGTGKNTYDLQGLTRVDVYDDSESSKKGKN